MQSSGNGAESTVEKVSIRKIKPDGTVIQEIDTGKALLKEPDFYIQSLLEDKEGNYYICYGKNICVKAGRRALFQSGCRDLYQ